MIYATLLESLHAALHDPDLAWYTELRAGKLTVTGYLDSRIGYGEHPIVPEGWHRYMVTTRESCRPTAYMEHWNEYDHAIVRHGDVEPRDSRYAPYDLYTTEDLDDLIDSGALDTIHEESMTMFKDCSLTDDWRLANSIWPEPELLNLVDDLTGRTGRSL